MPVKKYVSDDASCIQNIIGNTEIWDIHIGTAQMQTEYAAYALESFYRKQKVEYDPETREGVEAYFVSDGLMHFSDAEIDAAWPMRIKELLRVTAMAHYSDIVVKSEVVVRTIEIEEGLELEDEDESETEEQVQKRTIRFRRSHWRNLPADQKPSLKQFALAIASGKYSEEEVEEKKKAGHITFVKEYINSDLDPDALEPRKLFARTGGAVNFLNMYLKIAN